MYQLQPANKAKALVQQHNSSAYYLMLLAGAASLLMCAVSCLRHPRLRARGGASQGVHWGPPVGQTSRPVFSI